MTDTKLRLEDPNAGERALWDETYRHRLGRGHGPKVSAQEASEVILARRALFGQGESETPAPEKVKCPNCGEAVDHSLVHVVEWSAHGAKRYDCPKYAQPEPAAPEMPEAVKEAIDFLRELGNEGNPNKQCTENICRQRADTLESWWRNLAQPVASSDAVAELVNVTERTINKLDRTWDQFFAPVRGAITTVRQQAAQPVAVGMTEELEHVLSIAERDLRYKEECFDDSARTVPDERIERLRAAIAAVRQQAAHRQRPKLEKVRGALSWLKMQYEPGSQGYTPNATVWKMTEAALAELDAAEKGEGRG